MSSVTTHPLASVEYYDRPNQDAERLVVSRATDSKVVVFKFVNTKPENLRPGDCLHIVPEITGEDAEGKAVRLPIRISGTFGVAALNDGTYHVYLQRAGKLRLKIKSAPRTLAVVDILEPEIPGADGRRLLGPLFPDMRIAGDDQGDPYYRRIQAIDLVAHSGCNYASFTSSTSWQYDTGAQFAKTDGGLYDLRALDPLWKTAKRCADIRAARRGVTCHEYGLERISLKYAPFWLRSPLNARNNINGFIDRADQCLWYKSVNGALKGDILPELRSALLTYMAWLDRNTCRDLGHGIATILEGSSRAADVVLASKLSNGFGVRLADLWLDDSWPAMEQHLATDSAWRGHLKRAGWAFLQSCGFEEEAVRRVTRLKPFAQELGFRVMIGSDGSGQSSGEAGKHRLPEGTRPNEHHMTSAFVSAQAVLGDLLLGYEIKTITNPADLEKTLPAMVALCSEQGIY